MGSLSALADRIKIKRGGRGIDINLSVQALMACSDESQELQSPGSCWGGSAGAAYQWIASVTRLSKGAFGIPYETNQPYVACSNAPAYLQNGSEESGEPSEQQGMCKDFHSTCSYMDWARTCSEFPSDGTGCTGLTSFPNATVSGYGWIEGADEMMDEIYEGGPIACGVDAIPLVNYTGGIVTNPGSTPGSADGIDHVIEVAGWGTDPVVGKYWHVRNSWGEYWGEMGWARVKFGALMIEQDCYWADPGEFTSPENPSRPCFENGKNCLPLSGSILSAFP